VTNKAPLEERKKSVSPLKKCLPSSSKIATKKITQKENNPHFANKVSQASKSVQRKSISPLKCQNGPAFKKIELKSDKSPIKNSKETQK